MNVPKIIEAMGGRANVAALIKVCPAQMTQMRTRGKVADHHIRLFIALHPEFDWPSLLDTDIERFSRVLNDKSVRSRLRAWRGWQVRKRKAPVTTNLQS